ncbi:MAG TPA: hypothetical protein VE377_15545 [Candidatus Dormibacteraeota bacterium]|nr:hypothetical protein [Candidatus Dormibacteraeota bacterium]
MTNRSRHAVVLILAVVASSLAASSFAQAQMFYQDQEIQVHDLTALVARSHDPSDVLIASLDTVFHDQEICCGRDSALEDSAQAADPKSLKDVADKLRGRHLLSDGRPINVATEFLTPEAVSAGHVVSMIANQHAALMLWKSRLYIVYGVVFVWYADRSTGETAVIIRRFLLWDTRFSDSRRDVVFDRESEDPGKVQGLLFLQVEPRH